MHACFSLIVYTVCINHTYLQLVDDKIAKRNIIKLKLKNIVNHRFFIYTVGMAVIKVSIRQCTQNKNIVIATTNKTTCGE